MGLGQGQGVVAEHSSMLLQVRVDVCVHRAALRDDEALDSGSLPRGVGVRAVDADRGGGVLCCDRVEDGEGCGGGQRGVRDRVESCIRRSCCRWAGEEPCIVDGEAVRDAESEVVG